MMRTLKIKTTDGKIVILRDARESGGFICGEQVNRNGDPVKKNVDTLHLVAVRAIEWTKVLEFDRHYGTLKAVR